MTIRRVESYFASQLSDGFYEGGPYGSREAAVENAPEFFDLSTGATFFVAQLAPHRPKFTPDQVEFALTDEALEDEFNTCAQDWFDEIQEKKIQGKMDVLAKDIECMIVGWLMQHGLSPDFGELEEIMEYTV